MKEANTPSIPHTPAYRQSHHDSYVGWYESSLLSGLSPDTTGAPQPLSVADRLHPHSEEVLEVPTPVAFGPRERVKSLRRIKKELHSRKTIYAASEFQGKRAMTTAFCEHRSIQGNTDVQEVVKPRLSLRMPDDSSSHANARAIPTSQSRRQSAPSAYLQRASPPMTAISAKPRKSARFTRLIVEKLLLEPEEVHSYTEPNLEAGQAEAVTTKRPLNEMGPLMRSLETFFLLLPMLGSMYMLGSSCMPSLWWRERLSIVRVSPAHGDGQGSELLLSLWGWCVIQPGSERQVPS